MTGEVLTCQSQSCACQGHTLAGSTSADSAAILPSVSPRNRGRRELVTMVTVGGELVTMVTVGEESW